jgi:ElaB/YqjD/DUF883 family membrane-anchored ribosome-binding protein
MWGNSYRKGQAEPMVWLPGRRETTCDTVLCVLQEIKMETTYDGTTEQARAGGRRLKNDLSDGVNDIKAAASGEIKNLIADVEDLMARIADLKDADVVRVRNKVQRAVDATKQSLADGAETIRQHAQDVASTADDYVRDRPWQAIGIAALVGAVVGILATRRS